MNQVIELKDFLVTMKSLKEKDDELLDQVSTLFGDCIESPLFENAWHYSDAALRMAEKYFNDDLELISWFIYDNEFGKDKLELNDVAVDSIETFVIMFFTLGE